MDSTQSAHAEQFDERQTEAGVSAPDESAERDEETVTAGEPEAVEGTLLAEEEEQGAQGALPVPVARRHKKYTPWLQVLAGVVLICLIGSILLAMQLHHNSNGQSSAIQSTPTPILPLKVTKWCAVHRAPVDPQLGQVSLNKVVALSASDAWLLGSTSSGDMNKNTGKLFPLLEHWNGKTWSVVPTADTSALASQLQSKIGGGVASELVNLYDLAVLSDQDIWAVGSVFVIKPMPSGSPSSGFLPTTGASESLIEHWDGTTWYIVAEPVGLHVNITDSGFENELTRLSVVSANDIWAIGTQVAEYTPPATPSSGGVGFMSMTTSVPLVEHWDGTSWSKQELSSMLPQGSMTMTSELQAVSAHDVWLFGTSVALMLPGTLPFSTPGTSGNTGITAFALHWDGQSWQKESLVNGLSKNPSIRDVAVIADNNIWVASEGTSFEANATLYHWDGNSWSSVAGASGTQAGNLSGFAVVAPDNLWQFGRTSQNQPLLEHWNGTVWSLVAPTTPVYGNVVSLAITSTRAWALVQEYNAKDAQNTEPGSVYHNVIGSVLEVNC